MQSDNRMSILISISFTIVAIAIGLILFNSSNRLKKEYKKPEGVLINAVMQEDNNNSLIDKVQSAYAEQNTVN